MFFFYCYVVEIKFSMNFTNTLCQRFEFKKSDYFSWHDVRQEMFLYIKTKLLESNELILTKLAVNLLYTFSVAVRQSSYSNLFEPLPGICKNSANLWGHLDRLFNIAPKITIFWVAVFTMQCWVTYIFFLFWYIDFFVIRKACSFIV